MRIVIDAGVVVKWYIPETHTDEAELLIDDRFELHAPELVIPEFGNIIWKKFRHGDIEEDVVREIGAEGFPRHVTLHPHRELFKEALLEATKTGQAVYDWIYLALAISLDCKFVTADRKFFLGIRNTSHRRHVVWIENVSSLA